MFKDLDIHSMSAEELRELIVPLSASYTQLRRNLNALVDTVELAETYLPVAAYEEYAKEVFQPQ